MEGCRHIWLKQHQATNLRQAGGRWSTPGIVSGSIVLKTAKPTIHPLHHSYIGGVWHPFVVKLGDGLLLLY